MPKTAIERFEEKYLPVPEVGCWIWIGGRMPTGYGGIMFDGKVQYAHRVSYMMAHGNIPDGLVIDHLCRERSCVNPDHLRAVTTRENVLAPHSMSPSRINADKPCCPECGDDYSYANSGRRYCLECGRRKSRERMRQIRAARKLSRGWMS